MIISCPHCQTRYQVTFEAIGAAGRKVQCANCRKDWRAVVDAPPEPAPLDPIEEDGLDEALMAEAKSVSGVGAPAYVSRPDELTPAQDTAKLRRMRREFDRRRRVLGRDLPFARVRRISRWVIWLVVGAVLTGAVVGRETVVAQFPDFARLYSSIGLGVNVLGLDLSEIRTYRATRDGRTFLSVEARIDTVARRTVAVPPVVVTLLDETGITLYQWSVTPDTSSLAPGESTRIVTQLSTPPGAAHRVRLGFAGSRGVPTQIAPVAASQEGEH
jgi:predicted Zn finger-like uncharacterized protein